MPSPGRAFLLACFLVLLAIAAGAFAAMQAPAPASAAAPWTASNGVVLTIEERARLDVDRRRMRRHVAELEYRILGPRSDRRARPAPHAQP